MYKLSRLLSTVFSPILIPTYAMILIGQVSVMNFLPASTLWTVTGIVFLLTAILPALTIYTLFKLGKVSDPGLNNQNERTIPYLTVAICYALCGWFMNRMGALTWISLFFYGGAAASIINTIVNSWWKISAHAAALGGLIAVLFVIGRLHQNVVSLDWWYCAVILATGATMTARVYMQRHTLLQVLCGCACGFLCVWIPDMFI